LITLVLTAIVGRIALAFRPRYVGKRQRSWAHAVRVLEHAPPPPTRDGLTFRTSLSTPK